MRVQQAARIVLFFADIKNQTISNFKANDLNIEEVIADAGYSSGESLQYCEDNGIDAWIPNFGQYKPEREGFVFNAMRNQYECIQKGGNKAILPFKGIRTDSKGYTKKTYRSSESDCKNCPLREQCCSKVSKFKKLDEVSTNLFTIRCIRNSRSINPTTDGW